MEDIRVRIGETLHVLVHNTVPRCTCCCECSLKSLCSTYICEQLTGDSGAANDYHFEVLRDESVRVTKDPDNWIDNHDRRITELEAKVCELEQAVEYLKLTKLEQKDLEPSTPFQPYAPYSPYVPYEPVTPNPAWPPQIWYTIKPNWVAPDYTITSTVETKKNP